jgi:peptide-methionine (S)-S-oxide reductase
MKATDERHEMATETATFGAGCFWQVEAEFRNTPGVTGTRVGYAGGTTERPTYEEVCRDRSGHAEVVEVQFDPEQVSYEDLVEKFWDLHDPTQLNRQGPDVGTQYRSAIFFHSPEQERVALASRERAQERLGGPRRFGRDRSVVTEVTAAPAFWEAEDYHQRYLEKRGLATCSI